MPAAAPKSNRARVPSPVGVRRNPVGAPGGWKARTALDAGDQSLQSFDLLVERTSKVLSSVPTSIVTTEEVAAPS